MDAVGYSLSPYDYSAPQPVILSVHNLLFGTSPTTDKLNHLLPAVAIHSVAISGKTLFMPDLSSAFTKASLEIHALLTSPSYRYRISKCSMVLQKQEMYSIRLSST